MKKKIAISILILISIIGLIYKQYLNKEKITDKEMIAIFLEAEKGTGKYQRSSLKNWSLEEEYAINMRKSYCKNGGLLKWDQETKKISVKIKGSDECYVYFDKDEYGTKEHPYLIQTIEDLVRLSIEVKAGKNYAGQYFLLTNDLDFQDKNDYADANTQEFGDINGINGPEPLIDELMTGTGFPPIGINAPQTGFQGNFDGGNHRIDNLYIANYSNAGIRYVGLFGFVSGSVRINNLTIAGLIDLNDSNEIGGIVGNTWGSDVIIEKCTSEVDINGYTAVGGIVGSGGNLTIKDCINKGHITGEGFIGGIIGYQSGNIEINNCVNEGNLDVDRSSVGGILGYSSTVAGTTTTIKQTVNRGNIVNGTAYSNVSGIVGHAGGKLTLRNVANIGSVNNKSLGYTAGLIAWGDKTNFNINIDQSYNEATITGLSNTGGLIGNSSTNDIFITNSYNKGDVSGGNSTTHGLAAAQDGNLFLLNTFNAGNIVTPNNDGNGIVSNLGTEQIKIYNSYNIGKSLYGIGNFKNPNNVTLTNVYYLQSNSSLGSNKDGSRALTVSQMQNEENIDNTKFLDRLNNVVNDLNNQKLETIDTGLHGYKLNKWHQDTNQYPALVNE